MLLGRDTIIRYLPPPFISVLCLGIFTLFILVEASLFSQPDIGWHLAAGNLIRSTLSIPQTDPWSYASAGVPWYNLAWGWDVIISLILQYFGDRSLFNITYLFYAITMGVMYYSLSQRSDTNNLANLIVVGLSTFIMLGFSPGRPQAATDFFVIIYAMILHQSRTSSNWGKLYILPIITLLWVNMHGGFIISYIVLSAYMAEALVTRQWLWLRRLIIIGIYCVLVTLINPYGWKAIDIVMLSTNSVINNYLQEWAPFTYGKYPARTLFLLVFLFVSDPFNKNIPIADKLLTFLWAYMALLSDRHFPIFSIIAAPYIAMNINCEIFRKSYQIIYQKICQVPSLANISFNKIGVNVFVVIIVIILLIPQNQKGLAINEYSLEHPPLVSMDAIEYVRKNYHNKRLYNDYNMGGILIYYLGNESNKIYVDGRANTAYPEDVMQDTVSYLNFDDNWYKAIEKFQSDVLILYNDSMFHNFYMQGLYRETWQMVFEGKYASVYERKKDKEK